MTRLVFSVLMALLFRPDVAAAAVPLASPAAELCVANGAKIEIETGENGGQRGICVFPDGTRIPEWTYFRNKNRSAK